MSLKESDKAIIVIAVRNTNGKVFWTVTKNINEVLNIVKTSSSSYTEKFNPLQYIEYKQQFQLKEGSFIEIDYSYSDVLNKVIDAHVKELEVYVFKAGE